MDDAAIARELVAGAKHASLATLTKDGFPFGSLVAVAADDEGRPLLLLSSLAEHTKNLAADDRASLLFAAEGSAEPLASPRVTLLGPCRPVSADEGRAIYLAAHPEASQWVDFRDFALYRLEPQEIRVVVGFGRMSWVLAEAYARRSPP